MSTEIRGNRSSIQVSIRPSGWAPITWLTLILASGCAQDSTGNLGNDSAAQLPALQALGVNQGDAVVARGKLEPASGVIAITPPPGGQLLRIDVAEGDPVTRGTTLGELSTLKARQIERSVAEAKLAEAKATIQANEEVALANLEVARVAMEQAKLLLSQAEAEFAQASQPKGRMGLLAHEVQLAKEKLNRLRQTAGQPNTQRLVNQDTLDQQQLALDQSQSELDAARAAAEQKIESGKLAVKAAEKNFRAAEVAIESARASASLDSLQQQLELLDLQIQAAELVSPIDGRVLSVNARPGEVTAGLPIMQIADTRTMLCRAEVNVVDLPRIRIGSPAKVSSLALPHVLSGKVKSISRIIGSPTLPTANPLARVDWRSVEVVISIDEEESQAAVNLIHLQVDVAIDAESASSRDGESDHAANPSGLTEGDAASTAPSS